MAIKKNKKGRGRNRKQGGDGGGAGSRTVLHGQVAFVEGQVSIVRGASVRQIRSSLLERGFKGTDFRIQGVDIDEIDPRALQEVVGGEAAARNLPIVVVGIGPQSLGQALGAIENVSILPGGFADIPGDFITLPTVTITGAVAEAVAKTITLPTLTVTGTRPGFFDPRDALVVEGLTRSELESALLNSNLSLDRIRLRPLRD